ncbi:MAG: aspartate-alanine antiporter [Gammaproteobacteria bacterium]|nr:aspartate-alanine antiporter [Gammaproteobacteria bacterium]
MTAIVDLFRTYPQIVIFLSIAIGYSVGRIKFFGFNLGSTAGVLLVALVFGQMEIAVSPLLEAIMFALFIFCIGYKVGPEFFSGIKKEGIKYIILSFFVAIVGLVTAVLLGKLFHFDPGTTAGLLGGAMTQSTILGTAGEAIKNLAITPETKTLLSSDMAVAYAITYVFGTAGLVVFFKLAPYIMRFDLKAESAKIEREMSGSDEEELQPELFLWNKRPGLRVYLVKNPRLLGTFANQIVALFKTEVRINGIKRNDKILDSYLTEKIQQNDLIAVAAKAGEFLQAEEIIGPEVYDKDLEHLIGESLKVCILNKEIIGKTLGELSEHHSSNCFLKALSRQGHEIPLNKNTIVKKCDELDIIGTPKDVETMANYLGYPQRQRNISDLSLIGIGCAIGTLLGLLSFRIGYIPITLGIGGGVLVAGLICGWLRSHHPTFGVITSGAQWLLTDLGLNLFIVCIGLAAAPKALHALQTSGSTLFFAGMILTLTPMVLGIFFGRYILKINPALLLGALTGAGTITAALNAVKEEADSHIPTLGYTVPYAFGNVLLTVWGTVVVYLMQ